MHKCNESCKKVLCKCRFDDSVDSIDTAMYFTGLVECKDIWQEASSGDVRGCCPLTAAFSLIRQHKHHKTRLQIIPQVIKYWCLSGLDV